MRSAYAVHVTVEANNCTNDPPANGYFPQMKGIGYPEYACKPGFALGESNNSELCIGDIVGPCSTYPNNKTFGCGKTVADMEAVAKAADDPTRVFHQTQTCIARRSCDLRCRMDNCKWMDRVIPDFVNPYLQKTGKWFALESVCQLVKLNYKSYGAPIVGDLLCAEAMAEYHIEVDLVAAMTATGCGSDNDWNLVYQQIQTCPEYEHSGCFTVGSAGLITVTSSNSSCFVSTAFNTLFVVLLDEGKQQVVGWNSYNFKIQ